MSASRKLYVAVAAKIKEARPSHPSETALGVWIHTTLCVATALHDDNSGFDKGRFLKAAGFTDGDLALYAGHS